MHPERGLAGPFPIQMQGGCCTEYVVSGRAAMHHELSLAGPFPIGVQGGDTYRTKAVGVGLETEPVS